MIVGERSSIKVVFFFFKIEKILIESLMMQLSADGKKNVKYASITQPSKPTLSYVFKRPENLCLHGNTYKAFYISCIQSPKTKCNLNVFCTVNGQTNGCTAMPWNPTEN